MAKKTAPVRQDFDLSDLLKSGFDQGQRPTQQEEAPLVGPKTQRAMDGGSAAPDEDRGFFDFTGDVGKSIWQGAKGMGRRTSATADAITGDNAGIVQTQAKQRADSRDDPAALKALNADIAAKKKSNPDAGWFDVIGDVLSSMSENKEGSAQLVANQVPNIAVSTGTGLAGMKGGAAIGTAIAPGLGTIIGGTLGFLGGSFLGNALLEVGGSAMEKADDGGLTDAERNQAVKEGAVKSGVITTVEGLTMGLGKGLSKTVFSGPAKAGAEAEARVLAQAGVDITKPEEIVKALAIPQLREQATAAGKTAAKAASSVKSRSAQAGGNLALQSLGEGGGEYLGTMAATGEGDKYDAILEAFSSIPGSAIETADILRTAQGNGLDPHGIVAAQKSGGIVSRAGLAATPGAQQAQPNQAAAAAQQNTAGQQQATAQTPAPANPTAAPTNTVSVSEYAQDPVELAKQEIAVLKAQPDLDMADTMRLQFLQDSINDPDALAELYDIERTAPDSPAVPDIKLRRADIPIAGELYNEGDTTNPLTGERIPAKPPEPPAAPSAPTQAPATDAGVSVSGGQKQEADPLASSVIEMLRNGERASPVVLTRKLKIGFNRANRILEQLEADGIVGSRTSDGSRAFLGEGRPYDAQSDQQPPAGPWFDPETGEILDAPPVSERPTDDLEQQRKNAAAGSVRNAITDELNRRRELGDTEPGVMADAATNQAQQVAPEPAAEQATAAEDAPIEYHAGDLEQFKASSPKAYSVPKGILTTDITKLTDDEVLSRFGKRGIEQMADLLGAKTSGTKSQILAGVRKVLANRAKMKATTPEQIAAMGTGALRSLVSELGGNGKHLKRADLEAFANGWLDANVKMAQDKVATANLAKEVTKAARDGKSNFSDFAISKFARQIFENASPTQNPDAYDRALKAYAAKLMVPPLSSVWSDVEHFQSEAAKATGDDQQRYSDLASALEARLTSAGVERPTGAQAPDAGAAVAGAKISDEWTAFSDQTGTLGIPRAEMPQIKAEHRGAMVNFLKAKGIEATPETIPSSAIKPTQAEFSPAKVKSAMEFTGGDRAIIVSADGHVVDGHHQWLAKREKGEPIKALRLDTNIREVLDALKDMPSAKPEQAAEGKQDAEKQAPAPAQKASIKYQPIKLSSWQQAEVERGGTGLAGELGASTQASLLAMRNSSNVPELKVLKEYPNGAASFENPPQFKEIGQGFAVRGYNRRGTVIQDVKLPNGMVITRGLHADGALYGSAEGDYDQIVQGEGFAEAERLIADFFAGQSLPAIKTNGANAAPAAAYNQAEVVKQLADAMRAGGWLAFRDLRTKISDTYNLDARQTLDLGTLTRAEVGPAYDLEYAMHDPRKAGRVAFINAEAPVAPEGLSAEQAAEWLAGWDEGAESASDRAPDAPKPGEVVGEAVEVVDAPRLDGGHTEPGGFDSDAWDMSRAKTIEESRAAGNTHLDKVPPYVESMRGKTIFYVHDPKVTGVVRTVDNRVNVYVDWSDSYSAEKEMAKPMQEGKKTVYRTSIGPTDLKDYALAPDKRANKPDSTKKGSPNGTEAPETIEAEAQGPQTAAADAAGIPGARFVEELTDSYSGQSNFTLTLRAEDGSTLGRLDYTVYAGQPQISMLSVPPEHRRKGYGVALAMQLQQTYPETEIDWGTLTGEGAALYNSLDFREVPSEYAAGLQRLEEAKAERDAILAEVERFNAIESPTDAQRADYYIAIEPINDLHSEIDDLEYALQGKSPVKRLIVGRKAGVVAPVPVAEEQSKAAEISPALEAAGWAPYGEMSWTRGDADGYKAYLTEDGRMVIDGYENGRPFTIGEKDVDGATPDELVSFLAKAVEEDQKAMAEAVDEGRAPYKPSDYAVKAWREALDKFALRSYHEGSKQYAQAFAEGYMRSLDGVRVIHDGLATDVLAGRIDGAQFQGREGRQSKIDEFFDAPETLTDADAAPEVDMSAGAKWRKTWAEAKAVAESLGLPTKDGKRNLKLTELVPAIERKVSESQNTVAALPADPDVFAQELSAIIGPVAQDVAAFVDGEQERDMATFRPNITPVSLPRATSADPKPAGVNFLPQAEADKVIQSWMDEAARQGKDTKLGNYNRTIISLFDASGVMSAPWEEAGYNVIRYDIQNGDDIHDFDAESLIERHGNDNVWAVIAQPPCTDFASSGAQWWAEKDAAGITEISNELVRQSMRTIELFRPPVWWLENPVGRIQKLNNLPDPLLSFDPWHFGDPWTKRTNYWGNFNNQLPQANVEPVEGSKVHKLPSSAKFERSLTPEGVAYAMFMANNAAAMSAPERMAREFHGISKEDFAAALAAGHAEYDIKSAIEDSYYENDLETVRETLADLASEGAQSGQLPATTDTGAAADGAPADESANGEAKKEEDNTSDVKAAVSEAIDSQLKKAKAKARRLRTQAKAGDLTKDQKLEKLMAADEADSVLRRTRQQVFNAEDAALKALETGDITPFADYKSLFPALHKDLVSRIKRKPAPATEAEVAQQDVPTLSEEAAARLGALAKMAEAGPLDEKISDLEKLTYPARIEDLRAVLAIVEARAAKSSTHAKISEPRINFLKWAITEKENGMMGAGQRPSLDAENMTPMAVHEALVSGYMLNRHGETVWVARKKIAGIDTYVVMSKEQDGSVTFTKGPVGPSRDIGWGLSEAAKKAVASWDFDTVPVIEAQIAEQDAILDGILDRLAAQGMVQDDRLIANRNAVERNLEELRERLRAKWRDEAQTSPAVADFVEGRTDQPPTIEDVDAEQRQALANIFEGLSGRGLMRSKAEAQAQASPYASQIAKVESQFHDALIRLMEAGQLKVNGVSTVTEENSKCL